MGVPDTAGGDVFPGAAVLLAEVFTARIKDASAASGTVAIWCFLICLLLPYVLAYG